MEGTNWSLQSISKPAHGILYGVACASSSECEATGKYFDKNNAAGPEVDSWDGSSWVQQIPPDPAQAIYTWFYGLLARLPRAAWRLAPTPTSARTRFWLWWRTGIPSGLLIESADNQ
jgi:hypothetical protein